MISKSYCNWGLHQIFYDKRKKSKSFLYWVFHKCSQRGVKQRFISYLISHMVNRNKKLGKVKNNQV